MQAQYGLPGDAMRFNSVRQSLQHRPFRRRILKRGGIETPGDLLYIRVANISRCQADTPLRTHDLLNLVDDLIRLFARELKSKRARKQILPNGQSTGLTDHQ